MTRTLRLGSIATFALVLAGCAPAAATGGTPGPAATSASPGPVVTSPNTSPSPAPMADGRSAVILTSVDTAKSVITVDPIELYLGTQAAVEWKKDHPGETDVPPLNGHYQRNPSTQSVTVPVAMNATVKVLNEQGDPTNPSVISLADLATYNGVHGVYWITVAGGLVTLIEEQFFP
jgi:hypothetical protein